MKNENHITYDIKKSALSVLEKLGLSHEAYYEKLTKLRDKYLSEDEQAWFSSTKEIFKFREKAALEEEKQLKRAHTMGVISEEEYYGKLAECRDKHLQKGTDLWWRYTEEIRDFNVEKIKDAYKEIGTYADETLLDIIKKQEKLYDSLKRTTRLFDTVTVENFYENGGATTFTALRNLDKDNLFLKEYADRISALTKRLKEFGVEKEVASNLYDTLLSSDPREASAFADALNRATDGEFREYFKDYKEQLSLLDTVSKNPFREEWQSAAEGLEKTAEEAFNRIGLSAPETFSGIGKAAGDNFSRSFVESLSALLDKESDEGAIGAALNEAVLGGTFSDASKTAAEEMTEALKSAGFTVPDTFFEIGKTSFSEFKDGFLLDLDALVENVKTRISGAMQETFRGALEGVSFSSAGGAQTVSRVFSPTYHLYGSGETDTERIRALKAHSERERMAGGY